MKKNKGGRPSIYTDKLANEICRRLAGGESLLRICKDKGMPTRTAIYNWLLNGKHSGFVDKYEEAINIRTEQMFDDLLEIADNSTAEETGKARLRVDTRKWYLSKVMPKKYGEKLDVNTSGNININIMNYGDSDSA